MAIRELITGADKGDGNASRRRFLSLTGFSLVEVLVAVGILSMTIALVYGTFWTTMKTMDSCRYVMEYSQEAGLILSAAEKALCGAICIEDAGFIGKNRTISDRDADTLEFSSTTSGWGKTTGIVRLAYFPDEEGCLWQTIRGKQVCLTENLEGINFHYRRRGSEEWLESYVPESGVLPCAVKIALTIGDKSFSSVVTLPQ